MATKQLTGAPERADHARPTAPLPASAAAALSRLESAFPAVLAEQHRIERVAAGLRNGESAVINGTPVTAVSLAEAEAALRPTAALPQPAIDAMRSLEAALITPDPAVVARVNAALGLRVNRKPNVHLGETATHRAVWSQMELNEIFERVGGAVSLREVERSNCDGEASWAATEITLTVQVPDVGPVTVVTDIEDDPDHGYRTDVPVVAVARYEAAARHVTEITAPLADPDYKPTGLEWDDLAHVEDVMAGMLHLIGGAS